MPTQIDISAPEGEQPARGLTTKENMLETMASALDRKFQEYSSARENKEAEWTRAIRQYDGLWDEEDRDKIEKAFNHDVDSTPPPVNITRPKTNVAISRMRDSQFPVGGDYNFTMEANPAPKIVQQALSVTEPDPGLQAEAAAAGLDPSQAPTPQAVAQSIIDESDEAARMMTGEIESDLVETRYGPKARRSLGDLAILGSGIIKGPVLSPHVRKLYTPEVTADGETIQVLGAEVSHRPDVFRVDPRLFYPDPSARTSDEISDSYELHIMPKSKLLKLADSPAFMRSQVRKAVMTGPDNSILPNSITDTAYINSGVVVKNRYVVKEYHGPLDKQSLRDGGIIDELDFDDELAEFYGEVWICNGFVIRMSLSYLEGQEGVPYGIAAWEEDPSSVFGHGVPYLVRHPQRVINNAYLLLLDNASLTSGPQIVLNKEMIEPASKDGNYDISPLKVWFLTEYGADVREAMQFIDVPAQMQGISQIIDMAMQFSDMESSTPLLQQGDMPTGNNTLTGVAKVQSATNINQKRASLNWDDNITIPLVERLYHHEMQYGENESAKGDQQVRIGGATERIEAEEHAQALERLLGLAMSSEEFQLQVNPTKGFRQLATLIRAGDILRTPEEIEAVKAEQAALQGEKQPDPEGMKAQAAMITAQTRQAQQELAGQMAQQQFQLDQARMQADIQTSQEEALARREQAFADITVSQDRKDIEMAKLAVAQDTNVKKLANDLQITQVNNETARTKLSVDLTKFREEIQTKHQLGTGI